MPSQFDYPAACCGDPEGCRYPEDQCRYRIAHAEAQRYAVGEIVPCDPLAFKPIYGPGSVTDYASVDEACREIDEHYAQNDPLMLGAGVQFDKDGKPLSRPWVPERFVGAPKLDSSAARKATPIYTGVCKYFPLALAAVARVSKAGNDKHNPGEPLHWARGKSTDQGDALVRHQIDSDGVTVDPDTGELHEASVAWRALAQLQIAEEKRLGIYKEI